MSRRTLGATGANTEPLGVRLRAAGDNEPKPTTMIADSSDNNVPASVQDHNSVTNEVAKNNGNIIDDKKERDRKRKSRSRSHGKHKDKDRDKHRHKKHKRSGSRSRKSRSRDRDRHQERDSHRRSRSRDRRRSRSKDRRHNRRDSTPRRDRNGGDGYAESVPTFGPKLPPQPGLVNVGFNESSDSARFSSGLPTPGTPNSEGSNEGGTRRRKSRWGSVAEKSFVPGMPTMLPSNLTEDQRKAYLLQLQIEDMTRKLRVQDYGIPANPEDRSPSPEPIYDTHGKRLNTREVRVKQALETKRHAVVQEMLRFNPMYKPPPDYKAPQIRMNSKVWIPQENHPEINFVGLLIGPRGITLKQMEAETGARIIIRGKGSVKDGKIAKREGPLPGEDEALHAYVTATDPAAIERAVIKIEDTIRKAVELPDSENDFRKEQLRQLALLNGTLRGDDLALSLLNKCSNCGANTHKTWECMDQPNITASIVCTACGYAGHIAKDCKNPRPGGVGGIGLDEEYSALMAELGEGGVNGSDGMMRGPRPFMRMPGNRMRPPHQMMGMPYGGGRAPMSPWGWGAPMPPMPPWGWGGPMPSMTGGLMPPPPPPTTTGGEAMNDEDADGPEAAAQQYMTQMSSSYMEAMSCGYMGGWPPMPMPHMPMYPTAGMQGGVPPPPPPPDISQAFMPPPPPPTS